ncbi:TPA: transcription initiation factor IIB family protein [Candidatus Woesearchaeota archaeon]|nr:transcription initiation factor IIB family protein [Candidatus Woesearchaeota archaeon]
MECNECGSRKFNIDSANEESSCARCGLVADDYTPEAIRPLKLVRTAGTNIEPNRFKSMTNEDKNLAKAFTILRRIESNLKLPAYLVDDSMIIYENLLDAGLIIGKSIDELMSGCVHIACKKANFPIDVISLAITIDKDKEAISKANKYIIKNTEEKVPLEQIEDKLTEIFIKFRLKARAAWYAMRVLKRLKKTNYLCGKNPCVISASILYLTSTIKNLGLTQEEISSVLNVRPRTLRWRYKEIKELVA